MFEQIIMDPPNHAARPRRRSTRIRRAVVPFDPSQRFRRYESEYEESLCQEPVNYIPPATAPPQYYNTTPVSVLPFAALAIPTRNPGV